MRATVTNRSGRHLFNYLLLFVFLSAKSQKVAESHANVAERT